MLRWYSLAALFALFLSCSSDRLDVNIDADPVDLPVRMEKDLPDQLISLEKANSVNEELLRLKDRFMNCS